MQGSVYDSSRAKVNRSEPPNPVSSLFMMLVRIVFGVLTPLVSGFVMIINPMVGFAGVVGGLVISCILIDGRSFSSVIGLVLKIYAIAIVSGSVLGALAKYVFHIV